MRWLVHLIWVLVAIILLWLFTLLTWHIVGPIGLMALCVLAVAFIRLRRRST